MDMLERCHERLRAELHELTALAEQASGPAPAWDSISEGVDAIAAFVARSGRRHEQDEEESLFPRLLEASPALADSIAVLTDQHREHARLEQELTRVAGSLAADPGSASGDLDRVAKALTDAYADHIEREDATIMPATRALPPAALAAISAEMQARRGR